MTRKTPVSKTASRLVKLSTTGKELAETAKAWSQVHDRETGLIWPADLLPKEYKWAEGMAAAAAFKLGIKPWRSPTVAELFTIVDHSRYNPTINPTFFRGGAVAVWTSTPAPWSPSDFAMVVYFDGGDVLDYDQHYAAFVRPVRSARASQ